MANSLIQDSCKKASSHTDPVFYKEPHYYKFCIASLKENPESQKVKNIDELIVLGVKNAMSNMTNVKGIVEKILKERKYKSRLSEKLLRDCLKLYSKGIDWLIKALGYIKSREYENATSTIYDAKKFPRGCEMEFNGDNQQISPISKENDVVYEMLDIPEQFITDAYIIKPHV